MHLGIEIVEEVEQHRFWNHGQLRRTELQFAMMAQNHVLDQETQRRRKTLKRRQLLFDHRNAQGDMPDELALQGVIEAGSPAQLLQLANVMQNGAGEQQVTVDLRVMIGGQLANTDEG